MRFESIKLRGLGPFREEVEVDLAGIAGGIVAVTGSNGAGKSTLLELLAGAIYRETPTRGSLASLATARDAFVEARVVNGAVHTIRQTIDAVSGKGEALVLDETGAPVLQDTKVKVFDGWAAEHLPSPEVTFNSIFAAQGSGGFIDLKAGDRKAVLLRVLGVEHLEQKAEAARAKARDAKREAELASARLAEIDAIDVAQAERAHAEATRALDEAEERHAKALAAAEAAKARDEAVQAAQEARAAADALRARVDQTVAELGKAGEVREAAEELRRREAALADAKAQLGLAAERRAAAETAAFAAVSAHASAEREVADLEARVANNQRLLADAAEIRAAEARVVELDRQEAKAVADLERAAKDREQAARAALDGRRRVEVAQAQVRGLKIRIADARRALEAADDVAEAQAALPDARARLEAAQREHEAAREALSKLDGEAVADAGARIGALRGALEIVASRSWESDEAPEDVAARALRADDDALAKAHSYPERRLAAEASVARAVADAAASRRSLATLEGRAAQADAIAAARVRLAQDEAALEGARGELVEARRACDDADHAEQAAITAGAAAEAAQRAAAKEREALLARARLAPRLSDAEGRLAELRPRLDAARTELARAEQAVADSEAVEVGAMQLHDAAAARVRLLEAEVGRLATVAARLPAILAAEARLAELEPQLVDADRKFLEALRAAALLESDDELDVPSVGETFATLGEARQAEARARFALEQAQASSGRVSTLTAERDRAFADLADWELLAQSLGRDGLQAALIDCAGPELTELVNDLLRTCVGPRWTVTIETTRSSSDGKKQIEGCEVRVLDTERGRDAEVSTFSGGERVLIGEAVALALSMLACRRSGVERPTLVRDETGAALDPVNARAYVAMLRRAAEVISADRVLFVSHQPECSELADARIVVADGKVEVVS